MTSTTSDHPLDNVMWNALCTSQSAWARGDGLALAVEAAEGTEDRGYADSWKSKA